MEYKYKSYSLSSTIPFLTSNSVIFLLINFLTFQWHLNHCFKTIILWTRHHTSSIFFNSIFNIMQAKSMKPFIFLLSFSFFAILFLEYNTNIVSVIFNSISARHFLLPIRPYHPTIWI